MNTDIRIKVGQPYHRKTKILVRLVGAEGYLALIKLWTQIAQNHPKGDYVMTTRDVEIDGEWSGKKGLLTKALVKSGYLDKVKGGYISHDWAEHQSWVVHAKERSEKASRAAKVKWDNRNIDARSNASSMPGAMLNNDSSNARSNAPSPSPSPTPSPTPSPIPNPNQKSKRSELTKELQVLLANELHIKVITYNWNWSCLDKLDISNDGVVEIYRLLFDPEAPAWAKRDRSWLLTVEAPHNLLKHYQKFKDQASWKANKPKSEKELLEERLERGS